jgi:hypothetical protein
VIRRPQVNAAQDLDVGPVSDRIAPLPARAMCAAAARGLCADRHLSAAIQHQWIARQDGKGFGKSITSPSPSWRSFANFSRRERRLG